MTLAHRITIISVAFVVMVAFAFIVGRCTAPKDEREIYLEDPDGGFAESEYAARMDASVRIEDERLAALEREHQAELEAFNDADRQAYEETRSRGRGALAAWFKQRSQALLLDAGGAR